MATSLRLARLAALVAVGLTLATASVAAASNHGVPFHTQFSGSAVLAPNYLSATFTGSGTAQHLGRISTQGDAVVTGASNACTNGNTNLNTETLTAANGDTMTIASNDVGCPEGTLGFHGIGNWTVTGGTGRFVAASGSGTFDGHSDFIAGTFEITLDGSISY